MEILNLSCNDVAAAKSIQSCLTLCDPIDGSQPSPAVPGILQARTLEWVAISSSNAWKWKVKVKSLSRVRLLATSWTSAYQAPPSMGFSRQEYWSGVPLPSPKGVGFLEISFIRVRKFPAISVSLNVTLSWRDIEFFQMFSLNISRWSCVLFFINKMFYRDCFFYVKTALHSWDKSHLLTVHTLFYMFCWIHSGSILLCILSLHV